MLRTRLIVGTAMAIAAIGLLSTDSGPTYFGLLVLTLLIGALGVIELRRLIPKVSRPPLSFLLCSVLIVLMTSWLCFTPLQFSHWKSVPAELYPWSPIVAALTAAIFLAVLIEVLKYNGDGHSTARMAYSVFVVLYLGLLPTFLIRLRWLPDDRSGVALLLAIFVPKCCDIGAYFTGRIFGRTPFAPTLSPKKTWEGFAGGMVFAVGTAVGLSFNAPVFRYGIPEAVVFGLAVGLAGVFGDLAESMIKRDAMAKDASASVPGFGGVLDVIDSVIFAAPVAYLFLVW